MTITVAATTTTLATLIKFLTGRTQTPTDLSSAKLPKPHPTSHTTMDAGHDDLVQVKSEDLSSYDNIETKSDQSISHDRTLRPRRPAEPIAQKVKQETFDDQPASVPRTSKRSRRVKVEEVESETASKLHEAIKGGVVKKERKTKTAKESVASKAITRRNTTPRRRRKKALPLTVIERILDYVKQGSVDLMSFLYYISQMAPVSKAWYKAVSTHSAWKTLAMRIPRTKIPKECERKAKGYYDFIKQMWEKLCLVCLLRLRGQLSDRNKIFTIRSSPSGVPLRACAECKRWNLAWHRDLIEARVDFKWLAKEWINKGQAMDMYRLNYKDLEGVSFEPVLLSPERGGIWEYRYDQDKIFMLAYRIEHAKELGNAVPKEPFFFLKPTTSYVTSPGKIELPKGAVVHHEVELGVVIGKSGRDIPESEALAHVEGYVVAIDVTARDMQDAAKKSGKPWSQAKGFDTFTPIGPLIPKSQIKDPHNVNLYLKIDGKTIQNGNTKDMIFKIPQLINHVSSIMTLEKGDLILTGTPAGVGPMKAGSSVTVGLRLPGEGKDITTIEFPVIARPGVGLFGTGKV
ncbi:hypothetical protein HDV05_004792 [Chytridiales sp. JEL 0842]|nr:hypothetical protein HDV05_004792 [Chytridiales sp. JEL 0842]